MCLAKMTGWTPESFARFDHPVVSTNGCHMMSQTRGDGKMDALAGLNCQICQRQPQRTRRASEKAQDELTALDNISSP